MNLPYNCHHNCYDTCRCNWTSNGLCNHYNLLNWMFVHCSLPHNLTCNLVHNRKSITLCKLYHSVNCKFLHNDSHNLSYNFLNSPFSH